MKRYFRFIGIFIVLVSLSAPQYALALVKGRVLDALTGKPIKDAIVTANNSEIRTDEKGAFVIKTQVHKVAARAYGYTRAEQPVTSQLFSGNVELKLRPFSPKALYLTYYGIGDRGIRGNALKLIEDTELNALVIDVKGDRGIITYRSSVPQVAQIGAQKQVIIKDIRALMQSMKEKGVYTIARIVVFKDDVLASAKPELAIRTMEGNIWRDRENLRWIDPFKKESWEYNVNIAVEAAQYGFDEIQFDYVRFPDRKGLKFSQPNTEENRVNAISGFLAEARKKLTPYNVFVAADIFGYVSWNADDTQIGQRLDRISPVVYYISLMLYPSGFQFGIPGYRNPVANSYEIVSLTLKKAQAKANIPAVRFRPWLQAFRDYAFDRRHFYGPEIRTQIRASDEFGSGGWMLWNPRNSYIADGLKKERFTGNIPKPNGSAG